MKLLVLVGAGLCFGDVRLGQVKDRGGRALEEHVVVSSFVLVVPVLRGPSV